MKKTPLALGLLVLTLVTAIILITRGGDSNERSTDRAGESGPSAAATPGPPTDDGNTVLRRRVRDRNPDLESTRRELRVARGELEELSRPLHKDILSSAVNAVIKEGESLVTGGYRTEDGRYEVTFITPHLETGVEGTEVFRIEANIISLGTEGVAASGLGTLATNARNTLQHAEAWSGSDMEATMHSLAQTPDVRLISAPEVTALPSKPFSMTLGPDGDRYTLSATVGRSEDGGISIKSRIERSEPPLDGLEPRVGD